MLPLLLNKAVSLLWSERPRPAGQPRWRRSSAARRKCLNLALQGGGAHGAFTWGVLDRILADERLLIEGISGASAGAVNAVLVADGLARGGPETASKRLAEFWRAASFDGNLTDLQRRVVERLFSFVRRHPGVPPTPWLGALAQLWSPYDLNPLNINPLKELIERFVDFEAVRADAARALFVSATNVHTGEPRVFDRSEISAEVVMASACVPLLFRAVEIAGVPYWDGGYSNNPALLPFVRATAARDLLIVQINPPARERLPASASEIVSRAHEMSFNASLLAELRTVKLVNQLIDQGRLRAGPGFGECRRIRVHRIAMPDRRDTFNAASRLNNDYEFFERLRELGQEAADRFLGSHFDDIGARSTIDAAAQGAEVVA
jgi:NTE family protein